MGFFSKIFKNQEDTVVEPDPSKIDKPDKISAKLTTEKLLDPIVKADAEVQKETGLTPVEISFLRYVDGKQASQIALYWQHTYGLSIDQALGKYLKIGYATYETDPGSVLRVADFKELLGAKGLPKTGKKADLLQRFTEAYSPEEIESLNLPKVYKLTEKGEKPRRQYS